MVYQFITNQITAASKRRKNGGRHLTKLELMTNKFRVQRSGCGPEKPNVRLTGPELVRQAMSYCRHTRLAPTHDRTHLRVDELRAGEVLSEIERDEA